MDKKYLMGLDNGGTLVKAGIYDTLGNAVGFAAAEAQTILGREGAVERDMDGLWDINAQVIRECIAKTGVDARDILALAISGHGNGMYLVDEAGRPVRSGIYSSDTRAKDLRRRFMEDGTYEKIQPKTLQIIYAGQPTVLLAYFAEHEPETLEKAKWSFTCTDYIRFCLTGEAYGEVTNMSVLSAMNQYTKQCDPEIFRAFGIEKYLRLMPPIRQSCEVCGCVTAEAAETTGLAPGTPVAGGLFDGCACAIATGITDERNLCAVAGTWGMNVYICPQPVMSDDIFLTSVYCIDGYYMIMEGSMTSASNLEWFVRRFMGEEKRTMSAEGKSVYDAANEMVSSVAPEDSSIVFLPFLYGTNVNPEAKACFLGISSWHEKRHILRAIYEGVVFAHAAHIERLLALRDAPEAVRMAGGVTKSPVWMQMFADVLQLPIEVSKTSELGTLGAALCAGVAAGAYADLQEAAKIFTRIFSVVRPDVAKKEIYARKYGLYKKILGSLEGAWSEWRGL